jgi:hypothetical protein
MATTANQDTTSDHTNADSLKKHPLQEWLANAMRTGTAQNPNQSNFENILQQFPQMTEHRNNRAIYPAPTVDTKSGSQDQHHKRQGQKLIL